VPRAGGSKVRCPSCGSSDIRHSQRGGILDNIMTMFRRSPYRCRQCRRRFYQPDPHKAEAEVGEVEKEQA